MQRFRQLVLSAICLSICLTSAASTAAEPTGFIPADAEQVAFVNIKQLLDSKLVKKYALDQIKDTLENNKESKQLFQAINMDPMKDVHSVFLTNAGSTGKQVLIVLSGNFDTKKIHQTASLLAKMKPDEMKISKVKDSSLYEIIKNQSSTWAAFIDDSTLVVSPVKKYVLGSVQKALGTPNKKLTKAIANVDQKGSVWMAGLVTEEARQMLKNQPQTARMAETLEAFTGRFTISSDMAAKLQIHTSNAQSAKVLAQLGNQMKGILAFVAASNEEIKPIANGLLETLTIKAEGTKVGMGFSLDETALEALMKLAHQAQ